MRKTLLTAAALLVATAGAAAAQTQDVTVEVAAINELAMTGSPSLVINSATAGSAPTSATASGSYAVTTNEANRKITAQIDLAMPAGITLSVSLAAPTGASSAESVALGTTAADVVTGISTLNESGLDISYTLSATAAAGTMSSTIKTVTYTITAGA